MRKKLSITAVILTMNEEMHIERCIRSIQGLVEEVIVVDSYSSDETISLAQKLGARVYQNKWKNYGYQFNWALENCEIGSDWVWRIDADEYADGDLIENLRKEFENIEPDVNGILVRRGIVFLGKLLRYGTWGPRWTLKIIRTGKGSCETRWMDEHLVMDAGRMIKVEGIQIDQNLNDLTWWTDKHNKYANREVKDNMLRRSEEPGREEHQLKATLFGTDQERKRWLKNRYNRLPLFIRPVLNFMYRYVIRLGFLDGTQGFVWHILQGFWYRTLVDAKMYEQYRSRETATSNDRGVVQHEM